MRKCLPILVVALLMLGSLSSHAEAQLGSRLRERRNRPDTPAPAGADANANPSQPARPNGQLLQRLGGRLQEAVDSGTLDSLLGQAGAPIPQLPQTPPSAGLASRTELRAQFAGNEPFTPAWYASHPRAWQFTHPRADAWGVATISAATAWVGIAPAPGTAEVHTSETLDPEQAGKSHIEGEYLPLGVFALTPAGGQDPSALLQLAISKDGQIVGNYFDIVTGAAQLVTGLLDKHTQLATFKLQSPGAAEFEAALVSLTRADGSIRLRFAGGEVSDWHLARYETLTATPSAPPATTPPTPAFLTPPATTPN